MTSLSDSQNIDLDDNAVPSAPQLPPGSPLQACPHCEALIDITEREPLETIAIRPKRTGIHVQLVALVWRPEN